MENPLNLVPGLKYRVIKPFTDYDQVIHPVGETWTFIRTNFVPYHDGLTLHVMSAANPQEIWYRLQWVDEQQADIIDHFKDYVEEC